MSFNEWIRDARERIDRNSAVFPETVEQLLWLVENFPNLAGTWLPPRSQMWHLGLSPSVGRLQSFTETWRERLILTTVEDSDFRMAMRNVLRWEGVE